MKKAHVVTKDRIKKAQKIEKIILKGHIEKKVLSVGVGSGLVEEYLISQGYDVVGVDVVDSRKSSSFPFFKIKSEILPFKDNLFDVVISNHVIEHVDNQHLHLSEIARVKKSNGELYLATPNKWSIIEPHYHIAFLSWLPHFLSSMLLRLLKRNNYYDVNELTRRQLESMLRKNFTVFLSKTEDTLMLELKSKTKLNDQLIDLIMLFYPFFRIIIPTHIYIAK